MDFTKRRNDAVITNGNTVNGGTADIAITSRGSSLYFAICAIMGAATAGFIGLALTKHRSQRIFHYITAGITMVACIAYFSMGSNLGFTPVAVEFPRSDSRVHGQFREIFYVRYIDWFTTTPLLLMDLLLTAGMPWPTVLWVILIDEVMIVCGLVGALVQSIYKWGYFTFGCAALLYIVFQLTWEARRHSIPLGSDVQRAFLYCGSLTVVLWVLYPIAWGVCEGGNVIAPDSEAVFYGVLDFLAKPVFGGLLLWGHRGIDPGRLGLRTRDYEDDPSITPGIHSHREKTHVPATDAGATNGHDGTTAATPATATTPATTV